MPSPKIYKISYWSIWLGDPNWMESSFYVRMSESNFAGFKDFLRLNWPNYDFVYEEIKNVERRHYGS